MRVVARVSPLALHDLGGLAVSPVARPHRRHSLPAGLWANLGLNQLHNQLWTGRTFDFVGAAGIEPAKPLACKASALPLSYAPGAPAARPAHGISARVPAPGG